MAFNKWQTIAKTAYGAGDYAHFQNMNDVSHAGDTLFVFIMRELADTEDCADADTAAFRMQRAIDDIQVVLDALMREGE